MQTRVYCNSYTTTRIRTRAVSMWTQLNWDACRNCSKALFQRLASLFL